MVNPFNIIEILEKHTLSQPNKTAYIFLGNGEKETDVLTYSELAQKAKTIASYLKDYQGERALLLYPSGLEFISAFFGCLYAGVIPTPAYPPRRDQKLSRLLSIVKDADARLALTTDFYIKNLQQRWLDETSLTHLKWIATDNNAQNGKGNFEQDVPYNISIKPESLAFLQYTSGSTGNPKGVMISHENLMHNLKMIHKCFGHNIDSKGVIWLPAYHDMGLIGGVLEPIYGGFPVVLMPPIYFLHKPIRWLKAISKYKATTSGGPNFAYNLCIERIKPEQLDDIDLSSWDLAFNGAEPIKADTLKKFSEKFAPYGFKKEAFYPCYGMAETTLLVTGGNKKNPPIIDKKSNIVGCGYPWFEQKVMIVNPDTLISCKEGETGEIWVSGKSVAQGYWQKEQETKDTFRANIAQEDKNTPENFLRTGDLGFLKDKELYITGRLKEMIIIKGENHYPHDIEISVEQSHPALQSNGGAAFTIDIDGEEKLIIVQEVKRSYLRKIDTKKLKKKIIEAVITNNSLQIHEIILLQPVSIPKTSSGKIQRYLCKQMFLDKSLNLISS